MNSATRLDKLRQIEKDLLDTRPEADEASSILDALQSGLKERYDDEVLSDVFHQMRKVHEALRELVPQMTPADEEEILAESQYRDWVATKDEEVEA
jgi:hypothetical protein